VLEMKIDFVSLFPEAILSAIRHSIIRRAEENGIVTFGSANPRDFTHDAHRTVDDEPYGGGPGMVMKPDVVASAIASILTADSVVIHTDPAGSLFNQSIAQSLASESHLIFLCGHYEGIDERVVRRFANHRLSIGDYVLTGGELPAAVMVDAIVRLIPGVLGSPESLAEDAFADGLLTYPQFTRPEVWDGLTVPAVLLSGNHGDIARWRRAARLKATRRNRPDLFAKAALSKDDLGLL
jgi:tRNA (guanine37-N1)-methyltransferase